jgi:hypothetical protein
MDRVSPVANEEMTTIVDGFGRRTIGKDSETGDEVELLDLSPALVEHSGFVTALAERVARFAAVRHASYVHLRRLDRPAEDRLQLVSDLTPGWRLSELLEESVAGQNIHIDIAVVIGLLRQLLPAVALFGRHNRDAAIGALAAERLIVTPQGRLVIAEHAFGPALDKLNLGREKLWRELRVAMPPSAGLPRANPRSDANGLGVVALTLLIGRVVTTDEYPDRLQGLVDSVVEHRDGRTSPLSPSFKNWVTRALQLDVRTAFHSPSESQLAFEAVLASDRSYVTSAAKLEQWVAKVGGAIDVRRPRPAPRAPEPDPEQERAREMERAREQERELELERLREQERERAAELERLREQEREREHELERLREQEREREQSRLREREQEKEQERERERQRAEERAAELERLREQERALEQERSLLEQERARAAEEDRDRARQQEQELERIEREREQERQRAREDERTRELERERQRARDAEEAAAIAAYRVPEPVTPQATEPAPAAAVEETPAYASEAAAEPAATWMPEPPQAPDALEAPESPQALQAPDAPYAPQAPYAPDDPQAPMVEEPKSGRNPIMYALAGVVVLLLVAVGWLFSTRDSGGLREGEGELVVTSRPPGARVTIDGQDRGVTPATVRLPSGAHVLEVQVGKAEPRVIPLTIQAGVQSSQYIEMQGVVATGTLEIRSEPSGARVIIDGQPRGTTPATIRDLSAGEHSVVVEAGGRKATQTVKIDPGSTAQLVVPLPRR